MTVYHNTGADGLNAVERSTNTSSYGLDKHGKSLVVQNDEM